MLHGWGLHSGVWDTTLDTLTSGYRVTRVDLPGHGRSPWTDGYANFESMSDAVCDTLPPVSTIVGWSLGGMIALDLATRFPDRVAKLILVSTTPCFAKKDDWNCGMDPAVLASFAANLEQDYRRTVLDFLTLQSLGDSRARETLRTLRQTVFEHGEPAREALRAGMEVLSTKDLRDVLPMIRCPTLVIAGARDRLTSPDASQRMADVIRNARCHIIPQAGHAPFMSHPEEFLEVVVPFLSEPSSTRTGAR